MENKKEIQKIEECIGRLVYDKEKLKKAYNYYHCVRDVEQFRHIEENFGVGVPTSVGFTPLIKKHIDVAMPVFLESGETFPVKVRGIEVMSLKQIAEEIDNVIERLGKTDVNNVLFDTIAQRMIGFVLKGKLWSSFRQITSGFIGKYKVGTLKTAVTPRPKNPEGLGINDLNEGTVCFTNWSSLGKDFEGNVAWTPLLYPQVFLMAIGNTRDREYAFRNEKGEVDLGTKKMLPITLVFDHRLGGFADLAPFIKKLNEIFDNPEIIREW